MTVNVRNFKAAYPEFNSAADASVQSKIAQATLRVNADVFGDLADQAVMLLTAHLLCISPSGEQARLKMKDRGDFYEREFKMIKNSVTVGVGRVS